MLHRNNPAILYGIILTLATPVTLAALPCAVTMAHIGKDISQPQPPTPTSHPNLTLDFGIFQGNTEKKAEYGHLLTATEDVTLTVKVCNNSSTNTTEGRVKGGSKTDTRFWVRLPGQGHWSDLGREETKDSNPPRDD